MERNIVIIGGGPAGLAAAIAAYDAGERDIVVIEREERAGGSAASREPEPKAERGGAMERGAGRGCPRPLQ